MLSDRASSPMVNLSGYLKKLQNLAEDRSYQPDWSDLCRNALNGEASNEVQKSIGIDIRRKYGAFFTGTELSRQLLELQANNVSERIYYDPTCGMGDLLISAARSLPIGETVHKTLSIWGERLMGTDIHPEFVYGAKIRLMLLARQLHSYDENDLITECDYFPYIQVEDALSRKFNFQRATCILMNPPYGAITAPTNCEWGKGRITAASIFIAEILKTVRPGTEILAILPEVLRSGSSQARWREFVSKLAEVHDIKSCGVFDESADIDVFIIRFIRKEALADQGNQKWPISQQNSASTLSDYFDVRVGRVVPHRDEEVGAENYYIHPKSIPVWKEISQIKETRRHKGQPFSAPFVVIRRTSRPEQQYRAAATLIVGDQKVFVENHLIVCSPNDKSLDTCKELLKHLKLDSVNVFLNKRIRCRHLTVSAVREIPFTKAKA